MDHSRHSAIDKVSAMTLDDIELRPCADGGGAAKEANGFPDCIGIRRFIMLSLRIAINDGYSSTGVSHSQVFLDDEASSQSSAVRKVNRACSTRN